jgi:hypothetical protein
MTDTTLGSGPTGSSSASGASSVDQAKDAARSAAGTTASEARAVVDEAKESARDLVGDARTQLRAQAGDQAQRLAETLRTFGEQLSSMGRAPQAQGTAAELARQAGQRTQHVARRLESGGLDTVMDDAKRFARNRPGTFLLGALGAGVVVGRLLKNADTGALASAAKPSNGDGGDGATSGSGTSGRGGTAGFGAGAGAGGTVGSGAGLGTTMGSGTGAAPADWAAPTTPTTIPANPPVTPRPTAPTNRLEG